jgi:hypothetical protein
LFIDEADTFLAGNATMRGIINSRKRPPHGRPEQSAKPLRSKIRPNQTSEKFSLSSHYPSVLICVHLWLKYFADLASVLRIFTLVNRES